MSEIEKELRGKTGVRLSRDRAKMLAAIIAVVGGNDYVKKGDDGKTPWDQLSAEAQEWYNSAMDAHDAGHATPDFPDYVIESEQSDQVDQVDEQDEEENGDMAVATTTRKNGAAKRAAPPSRKRTPPRAARTAPARASSPARPNTGRRKQVAVVAAPDGARILIMRRVLDKPEITNAELFEYVRSKGSEASTTSVSAMRSQFRQAVSVLKEKNLLKQSLEV